MFSTKLTLKCCATFVLVIILTSCSDNTKDNTKTADSAKTQITQQQAIALAVYKSPTCGCCKKWISHIDDNGFQSKAHNVQDISFIKEKYSIAPRYRSCHTAISKEGYVFEGHVPAKFIQQFLKEQHGKDIIGLSVPAMPLGSPGMEVDDMFHPYKVLLLKSDGSYEVYANVQSYEEQF
ncbi:MAG: DUF411 domain-containing protein [Colwellia sp.]|nr:DUF411 domain-containing protein [Colwellia sp.]MCW8864897.1 DUF411 domain-containing protein [Colwellia sp.]MCW9080515.1 DUF411 domain-containing protein [Colwellia sp.]